MVYTLSSKNLLHLLSFPMVMVVNMIIKIKIEDASQQHHIIGPTWTTKAMNFIILSWFFILCFIMRSIVLQNHRLFRGWAYDFYTRYKNHKLPRKAVSIIITAFATSEKIPYLNISNWSFFYHTCGFSLCFGHSLKRVVCSKRCALIKFLEDVREKATSVMLATFSIILAAFSTSEKHPIFEHLKLRLFLSSLSFF